MKKQTEKSASDTSARRAGWRQIMEGTYKMMILAIIALIAISFHLGMHWEAMVIKDKLQEDGEVVRKWGNNAKVKITGVAEDL